MRGDGIVQLQLLVAQAIFALAEHIDASTGYNIDPVPFAALPLAAAKGTIACIIDSTVNTPGAVVAGGGAFSVLAWHNGADWTVIGA
jgi:hypothetical protein